MRQSRRRWRALLITAAVVSVAALTPLAASKGISLSLSATPAEARVGQQTRITLVGRLDPGVPQQCRRMRVVVVAPGVSVRHALRSLEGGRVSRRIGHWDAFRLSSLRRTGELQWSGRLRPNKPGVWTLVVPNWCADGYVLPKGVKRLRLTVR